MSLLRNQLGLWQKEQSSIRRTEKLYYCVVRFSLKKYRNSLVVILSKNIHGVFDRQILLEGKKITPQHWNLDGYCLRFSDLIGINIASQ